MPLFQHCRRSQKISSTMAGNLEQRIKRAKVLHYTICVAFTGISAILYGLSMPFGFLFLLMPLLTINRLPLSQFLFHGYVFLWIFSPIAYSMPQEALPFTISLAAIGAVTGMANTIRPIYSVSPFAVSLSQEDGAYIARQAAAHVASQHPGCPFDITGTESLRYPFNLYIGSDRDYKKHAFADTASNLCAHTILAKEPNWLRMSTKTRARMMLNQPLYRFSGSAHDHFLLLGETGLSAS